MTIGNRRRGLLVATVACLAVASPGSPQERHPAPPRPNVLVLLTDDQTFRSLGALGNDQVRTPNLDRLAAEGTVLTHCFNQGSWSGAVCICSRAMVHSGRHLYRIVQPRDDEAAAALETETPLWAEYFRQHGYRTFATGKWHNGSTSFDRSFSDATHVFMGGMHAPARGGHFKPVVRDRSPEGNLDPGRPVDVYSTDLFADAAIDFLEREGGEAAPWFAYVSFTAPHDPRHAPQAWQQRYDADAIEMPPSFRSEHPFDQGDRTIRDETLLPWPRPPERIRAEIAIYYAMISHIDDRIGDILAALERVGAADRTVVIFTSDQGLALGQHGLLGKQNQYDHSVRVPMIMAGPGIPVGRRTDGLVYLHQLYATTCELAGLPVPGHLDAPSMVPLMRGRSDGYGSVLGTYKRMQRMVRTRRYKLIRYPAVGEVQLFDLEQDPWETTDLADDPARADLVAELDAELRRWLTAAGAESPGADPPP